MMAGTRGGSISSLAGGGGLGRLGGLDTDPLGHAHQVRHRLDLHLVHDPATVNLDGLLRGPEVEGDLLVQQAGHNQFEHLPLAARQRIEAALDDEPFGALRAGLASARQRASDGAQQLVLVERLLEKIDGAALHGLHAHRHVAESGDEDGGHGAVGLEERGLKVETAPGRQTSSTRHATRSGRSWARKACADGNVSTVRPAARMLRASERRMLSSSSTTYTTESGPVATAGSPRTAAFLGTALVRSARR